LLVVLVAVVNFAIGFGLAVHLGHGPPGVNLPSPNAIRRAILSRSKRAVSASPARH
jgi:hypothetical protein